MRVTHEGRYTTRRGMPLCGLDVAGVLGGSVTTEVHKNQQDQPQSRDWDPDAHRQRASTQTGGRSQRSGEPLDINIEYEALNWHILELVKVQGDVLILSVSCLLVLLSAGRWLKDLSHISLPVRP